MLITKSTTVIRLLILSVIVVIVIALLLFFSYISKTKQALPSLAAPNLTVQKLSKCDFHVIGHRGNSYDDPEDTLQAVEQAFNNGANFAEIDIRLSKDGIPILMHDNLLDRTTDGMGPAANWTVAQLQTLDAGSWKKPALTNITVPTLAEVIKLSAHRGALYLDIKVRNLSSAIARMLKEHALPADSIYPAVSDNFMLKRYRKHLPNTPLIWFREIPRDWDEKWIVYLKKHGVVGLEFFWPTLLERDDTQELIRIAHQHNLFVWTYVINEPAAMKAAIQLGIDGIETDRPAALHDIACLNGSGGPAPQPRITGSWTFQQHNLQASIGSRLRHWGYRPEVSQQVKFGSTKDFGLPAIHGQVAQIIHVPAYQAKHGLQMLSGFHHMGPGSGKYMNQYTLIMDILRPEESTGKRQSLLQRHHNNDKNAIVFIDEKHQLNIQTSKFGRIEPNQWYRLAMVASVNSENQSQMSFYLNGQPIGHHTTPEIDSEWALNSNLNSRPSLLFSDNNGETAAIYVNNIQIRDYSMNADLIQKLGGSSAKEISF